MEKTINTLEGFTHLVSRGLRDFSEYTFEGVDFYSLTVEGIRFDFCEFNDCAFQYTVLKNCSFKSTVFNHYPMTKFDGSILDGCLFDGDCLNSEEPLSFTYAWLQNCDFADIDFEGFGFEDATLVSCNFNDCSFEGALIGRLSAKKCTGLPRIREFDIDRAVWEAINDGAGGSTTLNNQVALETDDFTDTNRTYDWAGWAVHLHPDGPELVRQFGCPYEAASHIYLACSKRKHVPCLALNNRAAFQLIEELATTGSGSKEEPSLF